MHTQQEKLREVKDKYEKYTHILKIVCVITTTAKTIGVPVIPTVNKKTGTLIRAAGNIGFAMRLFLQFLLGSSFAEFQKVLGNDQKSKPGLTKMLLKVFIVVYSIKEAIEAFKGVYTGKKVSYPEKVSNQVTFCLMNFYSFCNLKYINDFYILCICFRQIYCQKIYLMLFSLLVLL